MNASLPLPSRIIKISEEERKRRSDRARKAFWAGKAMLDEAVAEAAFSESVGPDLSNLQSPYNEEVTMDLVTFFDLTPEERLAEAFLCEEEYGG